MVAFPTLIRYALRRVVEAVPILLGIVTLIFLLLHLAPGDPATGTLEMRAVFPNREGKIFPGFFVHIRLPGQVLENVLLVAESALGTDLGGRYLMVVGDNDIVDKRYIEPGPLQADMSRVVLEGLEPGERYITVGLQRARPGMPVTPKSAGSGS